MKVSIELDTNAIDNIVSSELQQSREYMQEALELGNIGVFSMDPEEDAVLIKETIKALEKVLDFYTVGGHA